MKKKTIETVIAKKVDDWLDNIDGTAWAKVFKDNIVVTGGCIASMLLREKVNDYDIYFRTQKAAMAAANYYAAFFPGAAAVIDDPGARVGIFVASAGACERKPKEDSKYEPVYVTDNAVTLANGIQVVLRFYGEPEQIHENYDFIHCTNYWTSWERKVTLNPAALESLITKELMYVGSLYPVCSLLRIRKFVQRGFTINAGQMLKIIFQCSLLDLTDIEVLREQLVGVDSAYFYNLIEALEKKTEKDPDFVVSGKYLAELVERIF